MDKAKQLQKLKKGLQILQARERVAGGNGDDKLQTQINLAMIRALEKQPGGPVESD